MSHGGLRPRQIVYARVLGQSRELYSSNQSRNISMSSCHLTRRISHLALFISQTHRRPARLSLLVSPFYISRIIKKKKKNPRETYRLLIGDLRQFGCSLSLQTKPGPLGMLRQSVAAGAVEMELEIVVMNLLLAFRLDSPHFHFILYLGIPTKRICSVETLNPSRSNFTALRSICPLPSSDCACTMPR